MAPAIYKRDDASASPKARTQRVRSKNETPGSIEPRMTTLVIIGIVLFITVAIFVVLYFARKHRRNRQLAARASLDPMARQRELLRQRKRSAADQAEAEELERSLMIRKSLASRISTFSLSTRDSRICDSPRSSRMTVEDIPMQGAEDDEMEHSAEDWKEWEARLQRQRTNSDLQDQTHPAFSPELNQLAVPQQSRAPAPAKSSAVQARQGPLAALLPSSSLQERI